MNNALATATNEENVPFVSDIIADIHERKEDILRDILSNDDFRENDDGILVNNNKFLFFYGQKNTGKLTLLKKVAKEVYGDNWDSKIYLREDVGQRFPYKLHAHKVESSKRVIFLTASRLTWAKWKELYPAMRTIEFQGTEIEPTREGLVTVRYSEYFEKNQQRKDTLKREMNDTIKEICRNLNLSDEVEKTFQEKILSRLRNDWVDQHNNFVTSEVTDTTP